MSAVPATALDDRRGAREDPRAGLAAARANAALIAVLLALAGLAWWSTSERMAGMDAGPGTDLGAFGWFLGVWVVMMAAMMFPAVAPTVALYAQMTRRAPLVRALLFAASYLVVWAVAGIGAYGVYRLGRAALGSQLGWHGGGRWVAAAVLALAAAYETTSLKDACLHRCRAPRAFLGRFWREGARGGAPCPSARATRRGAWAAAGR